jgi:hypothetical protein
MIFFLSLLHIALANLDFKLKIRHYYTKKVELTTERVGWKRGVIF